MDVSEDAVKRLKEESPREGRVGNMPKAGRVLQTEMGSLFMLGEENIG